MNAVTIEASWREAPTRFLPVAPSQLDLGLTLRSGQVFGWQQDEPTGTWTGVIGSSAVRLRQTAAGVEFQSAPTLPTAELADWLRLDDDLTAIAAIIGRDPVVAPLVDRWVGLRLLRQDPAATLLTFLCTGANNIPRITRGLAVIRRRHGAPIAHLDGVDYHAFPTLQRMAAADVETLTAETRLGWRPANLVGASRLLLDEARPPLETLRQQPYEVALSTLLALPGVGPKIANCVCLFALDKDDAVPVDTHIWQAVVEHFRPEWAGRAPTAARHRDIFELFRERFGDYGGWAQQYLFVDRLGTSQ